MTAVHGLFGCILHQHPTDIHPFLQARVALGFGEETTAPRTSPHLLNLEAPSLFLWFFGSLFRSFPPPLLPSLDTCLDPVAKGDRRILSNMATSSDFAAALIIVDFQEDFCPPTGSLAVAGGRDIAPTINTLLTYPFTLRIATKDFHPRDHISFASNHPAPDNKPFESLITISNPSNPDENVTSLLWPDHCIQGTKGADLVPELDQTKIDHVVQKGLDRKVEMYSAFAAPFSNPPYAESGLGELLKEKSITHVYCVGLAFDYCVRCTAVDAAKLGFKTYVVDEGCRAVDPSTMARKAVQESLEQHGIEIVSMDSKEMERVRMC